MRRYECEWCQFYRTEMYLLPNGEIDDNDCSMHLENDDDDGNELNDDGHYCKKFISI